MPWQGEKISINYVFQNSAILLLDFDSPTVYNLCTIWCFFTFKLIKFYLFIKKKKKNMYSNTLPQVEAKILLMPCWLKIVLNTLLKTPLVKTFTSWFIVFKWSTIDAIVQLFLDRLSNLICLILSYCTGL